MRLAMRNSFLVSTTIALLALAAVAQDHTPTGQPAQGRIMTTTRLVTLFSDLEGRLQRAIRAQDSAAAQALLADDFDVTLAGAPDPIARDEWLKQALDSHLASYSIRQLAARPTGDGAVVSFLLTQTTGAGPEAKTQQFFIVDVWDQPGTGGWKLLARYAAPVSASPAAAETQRPTGKR